MKKLITDIRIGDMIEVDFGYGGPDFHWREVLEIHVSYSVFDQSVISFKLETPYDRDKRWFVFDEYNSDGTPYYIEVKDN